MNSEKEKKVNSRTGLEIAVIGMAGRFPGSQDIYGFWDNLINGVESLNFISEGELEDAGVDPGLVWNSNYVKASGGMLEDREYFDASFFDYSPREAQLMDPQFRVLHECAWEALEDAGYDPSSYKGLIGLYAGSNAGTRWESIALSSGAGNELGAFAVSQLIDKDYFTARVSHKLDLRGPAVVVQSACSTSLLAIHLAYRALLTGDCHLAIAGGVSVGPFPELGYLYQEGMILSVDGHCRAFDARAGGTVGGNGAGVVVLKPLPTAFQEGDHIYAIIKGSATNNDGIRKVGFTAPSVPGQTQVIRAAHRFARVPPESITYIETHGTGTVLGDPIEIEALKMAFNTERKGFCAVGSVKTNVGHLGAAAGVTSFIKTVLALKNKLIPPSLHFETPNPGIDFKNSPFFVNTKARDWKNEQYPLRAGVSSFGIGGTNVHVVLEEVPRTGELVGQYTGELAAGHQDGSPDAPPGAKKYRLILLSAKRSGPLQRMTQNLLEYFKKNPPLNLADAAYTLKVGRRAFQHRRMLVCSGVKEAIDALTSLPPVKVKTFQAKEEKKSIIFMFPGLGSQYVNMGRGLYDTISLFREEMDRCFEILKPLLNLDIKEVIYPSNRSDQSDQSDRSDLINQIEIAQLVVFIFEYALARLLIKWGIKPQAMIGYSFGEYTAACISGVFSLDDALKLIQVRGELMGGLPQGAMLSVPLAADRLKPLLTAGLSLAIDNGLSCIIAGPGPAVAAFEQELKQRGLMGILVPHSVAVHSRMMEPLLKEFEKHVSQVKLNAPEIPYISNVTGQWLTARQAADPAYWSQHLGETVLFAKGIEELKKEPNPIFIEVGPGRDLSTLLARHREGNSGPPVFNLVRSEQQDVPDDSYLLGKTGQLWVRGINPDWQQFYSGEKRQRIPLPTYSFERQHYRLEGDPFKMAAEISRGLSGIQRKNYFYLPSWKTSVLPLSIASAGENHPQYSGWLLFINESVFVSRLVKHLEESGVKVFSVYAGAEFKKISGTSYLIQPGKPGDYEMLLRDLHSKNRVPTTIVHLWGITGAGSGELEFEQVERAQELGLYSLIHLASELGKPGYGESGPGERHRFRIKILTDHMQKTPGDEVLCPVKAPLLAAVKMIPQQYPFIGCCSIDISVPPPGTRQEARLIACLAAELKQEISPAVLAYRGSERLIPSLEPVQLTQAPTNNGTIPPGLKLKEKGLYLVSGELEDSGFEISQYLALTLKLNPRLIFIENPHSPHGGEGKTPGYMQAEKDRSVKVTGQFDFLIQTEKKLEEKLDIRGIETYPGLETKMNQFCSACILDYFKGNSINMEAGNTYYRQDLKRKLKILPKFEKFYDYMIKSLVEDNIATTVGRGITFLPQALEFKDVVTLKKEAERDYPQFKGSLRLLDYCKSHYSPALSGEIEAISVLYPGGEAIEMKEEYQDPGQSSKEPLYISLLKEFLLKILEEKNKSSPNQTPRILEIGAGRGLLTHALIPVLQHHDVEYYFTDIGNYFVINGKKQAAEKGVGFMKFGVLDISGDPTEQGYETYSFDIVIGLNVVHATPSIEKSLRNLKQLLVPKGILCLIEATNSTRWQNMVYGLAEGWWYFEDKHLRTDSPLLSLDTWEEVFKKQGFCNVTGFPRDEIERLKTNCGLIIGQQGNKVYDEIRGEEQGKQHWQRLQKAGAEVQVLKADIANLEQMQQLVAKVETQWGDICGIIYGNQIETVKNRNKIQESTGESTPLNTDNPGTTAGILTPKIKGLLVLDKIFKGRPLDFFVICSSFSSHHTAAVPGGPAAAIGYCAADLFFDYFTRYKSTEENWRMVMINRAPGVEITIGSVFEILRQHFFAFPQLVVSDLDPRGLAAQTSEFPGLHRQEPLETAKPEDMKYQRSELSSQYAPPRDTVEKIIADIWQEFLGIQQVGLYDDFLELGADSLVFITIAARIHKALNVRVPIPVFFSGLNIDALARYIREAKKEIYASIEPSEEKEYYALSSAQQRLYILHRLEEQATAYNNPRVWRLEGHLDKDRFEGTFRRLIERHESLRTSFEMIGGEPVQRIHKEVEFGIEYMIDETHEKCEKDYKTQITKMINDFILPFDLSRAPLLRSALLQIPPVGHPSPASPNTHHREIPGSHYILLVDMHHIITDGISQGIMAREFMGLYGGETLPGLKLRYIDYSEWQTSDKQSKFIRQQEVEAYWLRQFAGEIPVLDLPTDDVRPVVQRFEGRTSGFQLGTEETTGLKRIASREGVTLFQVLVTLYNIFLAKVSNQDDIVIGIPVVGRRHADLEGVVGMFVNTLALRNYPRGEKNLQVFLKEVKEKTLAAFENQDYPFEELVTKLSSQVNRDTGRNPLFDAMFAFLDTPMTGIEISGLKLAPYDYEYNSSRFDLTLQAIEGQGKLWFYLEYSTNLFNESTIRRFIKYFKAIVSAALEGLDREIAGIEIIGPGEKAKVVFDFNNTGAEFSNHNAIQAFFTGQAVKNPDHTALGGGHEIHEKHEKDNNMSYLSYMSYISYKELNEKSEQLVRVLRQKGVTPGIIVVIMMERSIEMIIGILGILKAGGAYLPIDPGYPGNRINYMIDDSGAKILVSKVSKVSKLCVVININDIGKDAENAPLHLLTHSPTQPGYILYTSGSTGKPKGVMVEQRSLTNILLVLQKMYPFGAKDVYLFKTSFMFDVSVTELFGWFMGDGGGKLIIMPEGGEKDPRQILDIIARENITHINFVPSMFNAFLEVLDYERVSQIYLKYIFLAGEAISPGLAQRFRNLRTAVELENLYGPTEASVYSSKYSLKDWDPGKQPRIPIGKPLLNMKLYILNRYCQLQSIGIPGELYIGGEGVARGYLNNPELTAEKFIEQVTGAGDRCRWKTQFLFNKSFCRGSRGAVFSKSAPLAVGDKVYRTGDLGRWLLDGNIEFLGRIDQQVKIRGFRIEIGEVRDCLNSHPGVKEAVVMERADINGEATNNYLCAYFVRKEYLDKEPGIPVLKDYLLERLPVFMIPSYFVPLEKIPLTTSGKVDKKSLPGPGMVISEGYIAPGNETEERLVEIWSVVLNLKPELIGSNDNFFDLGGNSLRALQVVNKVKNVWGRNISAAKMFKYLTIRSLAGYLNINQQSARLAVDESRKERFEARDKGKTKLKDLRRKMKG